MAIQNFFTSRDNNVNANTYVGQDGRLWFNIDNNTIYVSDGSTAGGIAITSGAGTYGDANVVTLLANNFGSNTIVTTGNIDAGNVNPTGNVEFSTTGSVKNVELITFDTTSNASPSTPGHLCWNTDDQTLNLAHPNGVVQQIGQELYMYARNNTGNTISDGTVVGFAGAEQNGQARVEISPFNANGSTPTLYAVGVTTEDIDDGDDGRVTVWGKARGLNMSSFTVGDILYADPASTGGFSNTKPTAPNAVVSMAAVLNNSSDAGEIFVRPTILPQESYGTFNESGNLEVAVANTAYTASFDTTVITNGVTLSNGNTRINVNQSGYYQIDINAEVEESSGSLDQGTMFLWVAKNGTNEAGTTRRLSLRGTSAVGIMSPSYTISLDASDYIEIKYAADDTDMQFTASAATSFSPSSPSIIVAVSQIQL